MSALPGVSKDTGALFVNFSLTNFRKDAGGQLKKKQLCLVPKQGTGGLSFPFYLA